MDRKSLIKQENQRYEVERLHILQYPGISYLVILACILADAYTLYSVFELLLTERPGITLVMTATIAAAMNIAPMLLAACLRNEELTRGMRRILCTALGLLFLLLFGVTFSLRVNSQEQLYGSAKFSISAMGSGTQVTMGAGEEFQPTKAENLLAILLGLEPLATSICSFVLSYEISPKRKKRHLLNKQLIELEEWKDKFKVMEEELKEDMTYDLEAYDIKLYEEFAQVLVQLGENAKNTARRKLTEHIATASAVSDLMEGGYLQQKGAEQTGSAPVEKQKEAQTEAQKEDIQNTKIKAIA